VSLLSPERALIGLAPAEVSVVKRRGLWRSTTVEKKTIACDPGFGPQPWQGALAALKALELKLRTTVVLSNHFVRYAIVPWSAALASEAEELAYVRHHFAKIHGERAKSWALRWSENGKGTRLAAAVDAELMSELPRVLPRLVSVQPYLMAAINRSRGSIPGSGAWLALVEEGRACIALHSGGALRSVQNLRGDWLDVLERERHRAAGEAPTPELALVAGAQPEPGTAGWQFRQLHGGLAY
jgi:hypothetical protein